MLVATTTASLWPSISPEAAVRHRAILLKLGRLTTSSVQNYFTHIYMSKCFESLAYTFCMGEFVLSLADLVAWCSVLWDALSLYVF